MSVSRNVEDIRAHLYVAAQRQCLNAKKCYNLGMAIYHFSVKVIGRSAGRSATASAAYRAGEKILCERQSMTFNYRSRTQYVDHAEILAPAHCPEFVKERGKLWNAVEAAEKRKDAQVAREVEVALPRELSPEQNIQLTRAFAQLAFVDRGMVADACIHDASNENPHAHIMLTTRNLTPDGFGTKNRDWNKADLLENWRSEWEQLCNQHLKQYGHKERIDRRTLKEQGIDRAPTKHLGVQAKSIEERTGEPSHNRLKDNMRQICAFTVSKGLEKMRQRQIEALKHQYELDANRSKRPSRGFEMER